MPAFLMQIANSFLNIVLNSRLAIYGGDLAISTVGIISSVQTLMQMPLSGISQGQQPIVSYNLGAKLYHRCKETLKYTVIASSLIACIGFICIQLFPEFIISCFNDEQEIIELGKNVIRIWFIWYQF